MKLIQNITLTENVTLITLHNSPSDIAFVSKVFETIAESGIIVDMISQVAPIGSTTSLSFTISDDDLGKALEIIPRLRESCQSIKPVVSSGNVKIAVYGEDMRSATGVASKVFSVAAKLSADIRIVTTSEVDISLLLTSPHAKNVFDGITKEFA